MKRFIAVLVVTLAACVSAQAAEICNVYVNTTSTSVPLAAHRAVDATVTVNIPVPAAAIGIRGFQFGTEMKRDQMVRVVAFLDVNGAPVWHAAFRTAQQSEPVVFPGSDHLDIDGPVTLRVRFFNEDPSGAPQTARANVWVAFLMPDTYGGPPSVVVE
jgi:hypothetical protein